MWICLTHSYFLKINSVIFTASGENLTLSYRETCDFMSLKVIHQSNINSLTKLKIRVGYDIVKTVLHAETRDFSPGFSKKSFE